MIETLKITQALSEIRLANKKISSSFEFILKNVKRDDRLRDPFEKEKTTQEEMVRRELQSIEDNERRIIALRTAINKANMENTITIEGITRTIAEWIVWRRDILPNLSYRLSAIGKKLDSKSDASVTTEQLMDYRKPQQTKNQQDTTDYIYNISQTKLLDDIHSIETISEQLDGMLSLMNANIDINVG